MPTNLHLGLILKIYILIIFIISYLIYNTTSLGKYFWREIFWGWVLLNIYIDINQILKWSTKIKIIANYHPRRRWICTHNARCEHWLIVEKESWKCLWCGRFSCSAHRFNNFPILLLPLTQVRSNSPFHAALSRRRRPPWTATSRGSPTRGMKCALAFRVKVEWRPTLSTFSR